MDVTAFLFEGPCDGEVMTVDKTADRIEIVALDTGETHVYFIYSSTKFTGNPCNTYKFQETIKDE
jgi:hypothetical protein